MSNIVLGEQADAGETVLDTLLNRETILLTPECKDALEYTASNRQ